MEYKWWSLNVVGNISYKKTDGSQQDLLSIISSLQAQISILQGQMSTANTNITTLQGQMTTANTNIADKNRTWVLNQINGQAITPYSVVASYKLQVGYNAIYTNYFTGRLQNGGVSILGSSESSAAYNLHYLNGLFVNGAGVITRHILEGQGPP